METISVREGSTSDLVFQLLADNEAIDLTGVDHVELHMLDSRGKAYRYSSDGSNLEISVPESGLVAFTPESSTFYAIRSPYKVYVLVYESPSEYYSVPEGEENQIEVRRLF